MNKKNSGLFDKLFDPRYLFKLPAVIKFRLKRLFHEKLLFRLASKEDVFTSIWRNNYWGSAESLSGPGSTLDYTQELRQKMPTMFLEFGINSVFDAPCGDMNWMQYVLKNADFTYLGGDIVDEIVKSNKHKFSNAKVDFVKFDITADVFPVADLWLCRAVLYHLSNHDIYLALERFLESNVRYILTTNHVTDDFHKNIDITTGDWRLLNLTLPPFNFPRETLWEIIDYIAPHPPATLTLWTREQIEAILPLLRDIHKK